NGDYYGAGGGAIRNDGTLTVDGCTIAGNQAEFGGGLYNDGTLAVTNSTLSDNTGSGAGIFNDVTGMLKVSNCKFSNKGGSSIGNGGGIWNSGTATVSGSSISSGDFLHSFGGGIY